MELATREQRFLAKLIDLTLYATPFALHKFLSLPVPPLFFGALFLIGVQVWMLTSRGQTIGKSQMGLRILRFPDHSSGGFLTNVLLRSFVNGLITSIPIIGLVYALADPLFIFRDDRRCLHDLIAGTCVIKF